MGLEAESELVTAGETIHVKALLESQVLILRGAVKKTLPIDEIEDPRADGQAAKWLKKLTAEPPSLAAKLGIDAAHPAWVWGHTDDAAVTAALAGATAATPAEAVMSVAIVSDPDALAEALNTLLHALPAAPLWLIYPKGAKSTLPESAVRHHLRSLGLIDTKACAVSDWFTATRYNRPKSNQL